MSSNRFRTSIRPITLALTLAALSWMPQTAAAQSADAPALACGQLVETLAQTGRVALQGVNFDFNRATLRPDSLPALIAARDAILTLGGDWRLEGHTDNRGSHAYNQALSESRALAVRDWMVAAGVPTGRLAAQGFSFDRPVADNATEAGRALNRRVELVGTVTRDMLGFGGPAGADPCPDTLTPGAHAAAGDAATGTGEAPPPPPITDWTGTGGHEWLPFSHFMATGDGAAGWGGQTVTLPRGSQPQACQALCAAEDLCAGFSYMPWGSYFIEEVRCVLTGYGGERFIERNNSYFEGGTFHVSGLKPDARILTPESEALADEILADMAEIAELRATVRLTAPTEVAAESWIDVALEGHVPGDRYATFVEVTDIDDYDFSWWKSHGGIFVHDMADGRSGQIWTPAPGDYVLRYVIDHPTAGRHMIAAQPLSVQDAGAVPAPSAPAVEVPPLARLGTIEPGIDRPGADIAQTPLNQADPLACQAICAGDPDCRAWTYVNPAYQGEQAMCWTKFEVPEGFENPCCTSGVMDQAAAPGTPAAPGAAATDAASLSFPMVVEPREGFVVQYAGPLYPGDWIDIVTPGNDDDMSGGWGWGWAAGDPVTLTAPGDPGDYTLRYVAEDPARGRVVLAQEALVVRAPVATATDPADVYGRCEADSPSVCELRLDAQDVALTLLPGYGITEPLPQSTAGGVTGGRPGFQVLRLSNGAVIASVNARQGGVYCQDGPAGDQICLHGALADNDGMAAALLFGTLTSTAMAAEMLAMADDDPVTEPGAMQGVWWFSIDMPGTPEDQSYFILVELTQDEGTALIEGSFLTAPDIGPARGLSGDVTGELSGDFVSLAMTLTDGSPGLVFAGTEYGGGAYRGEIVQALRPDLPPTGAIMHLVAGPGEDWDGPAWMKGELDGMAAALRMGQQALQGMAGDLGGENRAMVELLGSAMGAMAGTPQQAPRTAAASPQMQALDGVPLGDLSADEALLLLAPHLEN